MNSPKAAASRHLALHATLLGVQRWRQGAGGAGHSDLPHAGWHAAAQLRFMDWLAAGGFKQQEHIAQQEGKVEAGKVEQDAHLKA